MRKGRINIILLAFSLILAAGMWLVHILSQSYYAYLPFNIRAVTDIQGYAPKSVSAQTVFLGGKASGFFILGYNLSGKVPQDLEVEISASSFVNSGDSSSIFTVKSSKISDRISESVNSFLEVTYIPEVTLEYSFEPQVYRKVPVISHISAFCTPQYMLVSDISCEPDSVTVYGNESDISSLNGISTKSLVLANLDKTSSGIIALEKSRKLRIVPESVTYTVPVARYVEYSYTVDLKSVNVPANKQMLLLPSQVEVCCRLPFGTETGSFMEEAVFVVDYNDLLESRSAKVAPKMDDNGCLAYSCTFNPPFVGCAISEVGR